MNRLAPLASSDSSPKQHLLKLHREERGGRGSNGVIDSPLPSLLSPAAAAIRRPRVFFTPVKYEPNYQYPLLVWLHNDGFNENQIRHVMPHISTRNFVGVGIRASQAVDAAGRQFAWKHTSAAVSRCEDAVWQAIDEACQRYSIHRQRIFLAGYGEGGTMARRVALQRGSMFAGCIALGGRMPRGGAVLSQLSSARMLRNFWAVATENRALTDEQFESDIRLASTARLRMDVRRYITDDEMVTDVLRDVNAWAMSVVTGEYDRKRAVADPDWTTTDVQFSAN